MAATEWVPGKPVSLIQTHLNDKGLMCDRGGGQKKCHCLQAVVTL